MLILATAVECGLTFRTRTPVTFTYVRNTERSGYFGSRFQQDIEPAGRYMLHQCDASVPLPRGWERGIVTFHRPLVIPFGKTGSYDSTSWKAALRRHFSAKGARLSKRIVAAGYDGIVTVKDRETTSEIIALATGWESVFD